MRTLLKSGVSVIALSLVTSGAALAANENFDTDRDATATVTGATSTQFDTRNLNDITDNTGRNFTGVMAALQNNGANSVINNGNAVSAIINTGGSSSNEQFDTGADADFATQTATVSGATSDETDVDDDNIIDSFAFEGATGVVSVAQNNGSNSAINNGNAVSGLVESGESTGNKTFRVRANNSASVQGDDETATSADSREGNQTASSNHNRIANNAFDNFTGVASVAQNNGANSAINNGNAVSGMVQTGTVSGNLSFSVVLQQNAAVQGDVNSTEDDTAASALNPAGNIDNNLITNDAFQDADGVVSVAQNNGANSAINNGNGVSGIVNSGQNVNANAVNFNSVGVENSQIATVGGNLANIVDIENDDSPNDNLINSNAFQNFEGVASVLQNNGPNSAINNGNSVSAVVLDGAAISSGNTNFDADSTQSALVDAGGGTISANLVFFGQTDNNTITNNAYQNFSGVSSTVQNNGSNAAINNGNLVAAFIGEENNASTGDANNLRADTNSQTATVQSAGGTVVSSEQDNSHDTNLITENTFSSAEGVHSVAQNNGASAAINNGNSVVAIIVDNSIANAKSMLDVVQSQTAKVLAVGDASSVTNTETEVNDTNTASGSTFNSADGVASVFQNNAANSAINNGNTVAILLSDDMSIDLDGGTFDGDVPPVGTVSQTAEVNATSPVSNSESMGSLDSNLITDNAFQSSEGVYSVGQNNGPNSAINNGNTVAAAVADDGNATTANGVNFDVDATQTATVGTTGAVISTELGGSNDTNRINDNAFQNAAGVFSVLQNNGPNSAINNGNTVAAIIADCAGCAGANTFTTNANYNGTVGAFVVATNTAVTNTNQIVNNAFQNSRGIFSVTQNNGANAALSNGNVVSAIVEP